MTPPNPSTVPAASGARITLEELQNANKLDCVFEIVIALEGPLGNVYHFGSGNIQPGGQVGEDIWAEFLPQMLQNITISDKEPIDVPTPVTTTAYGTGASNPRGVKRQRPRLLDSRTMKVMKLESSQERDLLKTDATGAAIRASGDVQMTRRIAVSLYQYLEKEIAKSPEGSIRIPKDFAVILRRALAPTQK
ncbi:hypothetical protein BX600DRAFT_110682 [Xylariales sp. PMI_506]|nr:hypothetical protein BX600DRAFT_110682 [Xylariales sp. PMI_506]